MPAPMRQPNTTQMPLLRHKLLVSPWRFFKWRYSMKLPLSANNSNVECTIRAVLGS